MTLRGILEGDQLSFELGSEPVDEPGVGEDEVPMASEMSGA